MRSLEDARFGRLARPVRRMRCGLATLESDCRKLTSYGVAARYPDDLFEPDEADGRDVVAAAHRVRTKILLLLPKNR